MTPEIRNSGTRVDVQKRYSQPMNLQVSESINLLF
jgi:hypothetical protein